MAYGRDVNFYASLGPDHPVNKSRPRMDEDTMLLMELFLTLSLSRPIFFDGPGYIPLTEIEAFCRMAGFEPTEHLDVANDIRSLDVIYLRLIEKQRTAKQTFPQPKKVMPDGHS